MQNVQKAFARLYRSPFFLLLLFAPIMLLFMGETGCETLNLNNGSGSSDSSYDHHDDYDHHDSDYGGNGEMRVYDYYPEREVFFNHTTREWTYWNDNKLERRRDLPDFIRDQMGHQVREVHLRGDTPENYIDRVKRDYPGSGRDWQHDSASHDMDHHDNDHHDDNWAHRNDRIPPDARVYGNHDDAQPYDYYPGRNIYYNVTTHTYTWQNNGRWDSGDNVPDFLRKDMGNHERIFIAGTPQHFNDDVRRDFH